MLISRLIPQGMRVRRNHLYFPGERSIFSRTYRRAVDDWLVRRSSCTDYFFRLPTTAMEREMKRIANLSRTSVVELAVHLETKGEYDFLMSDAYLDCMAGGAMGAYEECPGTGHRSVAIGDGRRDACGKT